MLLIARDDRIAASLSAKVTETDPIFGHGRVGAPKTQLGLQFETERLGNRKSERISIFSTKEFLLGDKFQLVKMNRTQYSL